MLGGMPAQRDLVAHPSVAARWSTPDHDDNNPRRALRAHRHRHLVMRLAPEHDAVERPLLSDRREAELVQPLGAVLAQAVAGDAAGAALAIVGVRAALVVVEEDVQRIARQRPHRRLVDALQGKESVPPRVLGDARGSKAV